MLPLQGGHHGPLVCSSCFLRSSVHTQALKEWPTKYGFWRDLGVPYWLRKQLTNPG